MQRSLSQHLLGIANARPPHLRLDTAGLRAQACSPKYFKRVLTGLYRFKVPSSPQIYGLSLDRIFPIAAAVHQGVAKALFFTRVLKEPRHNLFEFCSAHINLLKNLMHIHDSSVLEKDGLKRS